MSQSVSSTQQTSTSTSTSTVINYRHSVILQLHKLKVVVSFIFNKMLNYCSALQGAL